MDKAKAEALAASKDMDPIEGTIDVNIPIDALWTAFRDASQWRRWNRCMFWARNKDLVKGETLRWCFNAIRWYYPYKLPAKAEIIEVVERRKVTWEVNLLGFFAHHTYSMEDLGDGRARFGSWEKANGPSFRIMRPCWRAHFTFVKDESLKGVKTLEALYLREGRLDMSKLRKRSPAPLLVALALLLGVAVGATWAYRSFLRVAGEELAPGVYVVSGGCNSIVVEDGGETLVVDPKFPPISNWLHSWLERHTSSPVTRVVNTHFHFDHTQGNVIYPGARIVAHAGAEKLMQLRDGDFWRGRLAALPAKAEAIGAPRSFKVGFVDLELTPVAHAHTRSDVWIHLRKGSVEVVALGDIFFNGYYPFIDTGEGGSDLTGVIRTLRDLASRYPGAIFVPGHGPVAKADGVRRYADYLEALDRAVQWARAKGLSEDEAAKSIDLSSWRLSILPILHYGAIVSTADSNIRQAYRLRARAEPRFRSASPFL